MILAYMSDGLKCVSENHQGPILNRTLQLVSVNTKGGKNTIFPEIQDRRQGYAISIKTTRECLFSPAN